MRVRIITRHPGELDGIALSAFQTGFTYDIASTIATYLVTVGCAEPLMNATPATWTRDKVTSRQAGALSLFPSPSCP